MCDLVLLCTVGYWLHIYRTWNLPLDIEAEIFLTQSGSREVRKIDEFGLTAIIKWDRKEFNLMIFLSIITVTIWLRFLLMLQLTRTFGPMLRIIISMFGEVLKFLVIWSVVLLCLTSVATLLFGELEAYSKFVDVSFISFDTGLGNYDLTAFETLKMSELVGQVFLVIAVLINGVVLLNFIIAILADTYSKLSKQSLGIYYDGVIARIPVYEDDSRYGGLIVGLPPMNVLALFMAPFYCCIKDENRLRKLNDRFTKVIFAPVALIITAFFVASNLVLLPFAYLAALYKKAQLLREKNKLDTRIASMTLKKASVVSWTDILVFTILGIPLLLFAQVKDAWNFLSLIYRDDTKEFNLNAKKEHVMT